VSELYGPEFFQGRSDTVILSASVVVPHIITMLAPRSVLDVGCGKGEWMDVFAEHGVEVFGVDIAAPEGAQYLHQDLNWPLQFDRTFDIALSLEVGEHLPQAAARTFVYSMTAHSNTVVFSAAVPGQEGKGHINCQPHDYWHEMFDLQGFACLDAFRPLIANDWRVSPWYRDNIFLYVRR